MLLLITAAGAGSRFRKEGISTPKPLIRVDGKTLLEHTLSSFELEEKDSLIIAVQRAHAIPSQQQLKLPQVPISWIELDELLPGQLATAVHALRLSQNESKQDTSLLIHNCDTGFEWNSELRPPIESYGAMAVFEAEGEHWSFGQPDPNDPSRAIAIAEKQRISNLASIGLYGFRSTHEFLADAERQLQGKNRVNGEHYVAPLLNQAIADGNTVLLPQAEGLKLYGTPKELCSTFEISMETLKKDNN